MYNRIGLAATLLLLTLAAGVFGPRMSMSSVTLPAFPWIRLSVPC